MISTLDSCIAKIDRAKEHCDALGKYVDDTFAVEANRPRLGIRFDADTKDHIVFINYMPDLSVFLDRCSLIYGDAVNNLRVALDRVAYQLALLHTGGKIQAEAKIQFPICDTLESFNNFKTQRLKEISPVHIAIMERVQGYHTIDENVCLGMYFHPLVMLRELVNIDKHRLPIKLVIPTSGMHLYHPLAEKILSVAFMNQLGRDERGLYKICPLQFPVAELGAVVMRAKLSSGALETEVSMAGYVSAMVAIEGDRSAISSLNKMAAVIVKILHEFEPSFQ